MPSGKSINDASNYWVFDWLLENHITSLEEAARFLPKYRVLNTLQQRAERAAKLQKGPIPIRNGPSIVAATGLDLSGGRMVCPAPSCMRLQVDKLLRHVWHYFDTVVVDDVLTPLLSDEWRGTKKDLIREILPQLAPLLYLKEIGASELVEFRSKSRCVEHWEDHARDEGLGALLDSKSKLISDLIAGANFCGRNAGEGTLYEMECLDAGVTLSMLLAEKNKEQAKIHLASEVLKEYMVDLVADVLAARQWQLPLGSAQAFVGRMLQMSRPASVADVIFQLDLPIIEEIPAADLIAIRRDQSEYFSNFRNALRRAAK